MASYYLIEIALGAGLLASALFLYAYLREAKLAAQRSENLSERMMEASLGGVLLVSPLGVVLKANAEAQRILGLGSRELGKFHLDEFEDQFLREDGSPNPIQEHPASR